MALFEPCLVQGVTDYFAGLNRSLGVYGFLLLLREFLSAFAGIDMEEREAPEILEVGDSEKRTKRNDVRYQQR